MLLLDGSDGSVVAVHPRIVDHITSRLRADRIDLDLAGGGPPDATIGSALRARALTSTRTRVALARGLQQTVARAMAPSVAAVGGSPLDRAALLSAAADIEELRGRLLADGPVSVRGVAQTKVLLTTVLPLPNRRSNAGTMAAQIRRAIDALRIVSDARADT
ncbi:MAG: hypothetical protein JWO57_4420 [Pseudonocardiales bacterium]|nr:hypothetical protein [Pseudonocardiales bacterium]